MARHGSAPCAHGLGRRIDRRRQPQARAGIVDGVGRRARRPARMGRPLGLAAKQVAVGRMVARGACRLAVHGWQRRGRARQLAGPSRLAGRHQGVWRSPRPARRVGAPHCARDGGTAMSNWRRSQKGRRSVGTDSTKAMKSRRCLDSGPTARLRRAPAPRRNRRQSLRTWGT